jgi:acylglycerol lipase
MPPAIEHITYSDGYRAAVRWWRPTNPRGAVLYFHGIQSHGGWYEQSGEALVASGLTVLMPDRRGSGLNPLERGHVDSMDRAFMDACEALDALLAATSRSHCGTGLPTGQPAAHVRGDAQPAAHVVGVSWGGKLAVCLAAISSQRVASISLVAPGLFPRIDLTAVEKFRVGVALINDRQRTFPIPLNDPAFFTANPDRVRFVETDPLMLRHVTAPFLLATRRMDRVVRQLDRSAFRNPVHLLLAGHDRIIDNDRTRRWLRSLPSPDRRITDYPTSRHTLEFDPDPQPFLDDLSKWITDRCPAQLT